MAIKNMYNNYRKTESFLNLKEMLAMKYNCHQRYMCEREFTFYKVIFY